MAKHSIAHHLYEESQIIQMKLFKKNRLTDTENNLKVTKGERDKFGIWV